MGLGLGQQPIRARPSALILVTPPATDPLAWALSHVASSNAGLSESGDNISSSGAVNVVLTRSNSHTAQYAQIVRDVAAQHNLPLVDLFALTNVQQPEQTNPYLCDGLHLSPAGNLLLYRAILQCIDEQLPHLALRQLPLDAPYHANITPDNYAALFDMQGE